MQTKFDKKILDDIKKVNISYDKFVHINHLLNQFLLQHGFDDCYIDSDVGSTGHENVFNLDVYLQNTNINDCLEFQDEFLNMLIDNDVLNYDDYKNMLVHFIPSQ